MKTKKDNTPQKPTEAENEQTKTTQPTVDTAQQSEKPTTAPPPNPEDDPRIKSLIDEAEQRGYMRGRNESIEELMRRPGMMERMPEERSADPSADSEPLILSNRRISIWDK